MKTLKITIAAAVAMTLLAGCGNDPERGQLLKSIGKSAKSITQSKSGSGAGTAAVPTTIEQADAGALAHFKAPLLRAQISKTGVAGYLQQVASNGAYRTYATTDSQSMTLRRGVLTATRGLGTDLMSADVSGLSSLLARRQSGNAVRVMRHLNGEDVTEERRFNCEIRVGGREDIDLGLVRTTTRKMTEDCSDGRSSFQNVYLVGSDGTVLQSEQWISDALEHALILTLRR